MNWYNETQLHTPTEATNPTVSSPLAHLPADSVAFVSIEDHSQWEHYVNNTLKAMESKLESVSMMFFMHRAGKMVTSRGKQTQISQKEGLIISFHFL